jgi:hypothetical protein
MPRLGRWVNRLEALASRKESPERRAARLEGLARWVADRYGDDSQRATLARKDLAEALERAGRLEEAVVVRKRMLATLEGRFGPGEVLCAQEELCIANDLAKLSRVEDARVVLEHALLVFRALCERDDAWRLAAEELLRTMGPTPRQTPGRAVSPSVATSRGSYQGTAASTYLAGKPQHPQEGSTMFSRKRTRRPVKRGSFNDSTGISPEKGHPGPDSDKSS